MMFPDSEALVQSFLAARTSPVPVVTKVPSKNRPALFVRCWRTGGPSMNRVLDQPIITVQAWGADSVTASELSSKCRQWLLADSGSMPLVRGIEEVTGQYYDPDPDTGIDRYTFSVQMKVRAQR